MCSMTGLAEETQGRWEARVAAASGAGEMRVGSRRTRRWKSNNKSSLFSLFSRLRLSLPTCSGTWFSYRYLLPNGSFAAPRPVLAPPPCTPLPRCSVTYARCSRAPPGPVFRQ